MEVIQFPVRKDPLGPLIDMMRESTAREHVFRLDRRITLLRNEALVLRRRRSTKKAGARLLEAELLQAELREYLYESGMDNRGIANH